MKNLESFGVQELNAMEVRETDGGILPLLALVVYDAICLGFLAGAAHETFYPSEY